MEKNRDCDGKTKKNLKHLTKTQQINKTNNFKIIEYLLFPDVFHLIFLMFIHGIDSVCFNLTSVSVVAFNLSYLYSKIT